LLQRPTPSSNYSVVDKLTFWCRLESILMIIIYPISQKMKPSMPLLGEYRCYTDFRYAQPLQILIAEVNTINMLLCS
jgi:hypothetical protein